MKGYTMDLARRHHVFGVTGLNGSRLTAPMNFDGENRLFNNALAEDP